MKTNFAGILQVVMYSAIVHHRFCLRAVRCSRQAFPVTVRAAKGFGTNPKPVSDKSKGKKKRKSGDAAAKLSSDQAVQRAVDIAEGSRKARPVTDAEAGKGRLDYVRVKDWGSGDRKDLGSLKVDSVSRVTTNPIQPFYEQLARHLEMCQARGDLQPPASQRLPPFERWAFRRGHYLQYLVDQFAFHRALETATTAALRPPMKEYMDSADQSPADAARGSSEFPAAFATEVCAALDAFHPSDAGGLARADALSADLGLIAERSPAEDRSPYQLDAGKHAKTYVEHLDTIASAAQDESLGISAQDAARMQLLAHLYSAYVTHLTTGMRIGAAAAEKLDLFQIGATHNYQDYPAELDDPLKYFVNVINQIGKRLSSENKQRMFEELPDAFLRTSQMLTALAKSE